MNPRYTKPLSSFAPELLELLLKAAVSEVELFAEADKAAPTLHDKAVPTAPQHEGCVVMTRWHKCVFSSATAAARFRTLMTTAQRLHELRLTMKAAQHPDAAKAYSVRISLDDRRGSLRVGPADSALRSMLAEAGIAAPSIAADSDPLASMGDLE